MFHITEAKVMGAFLIMDQFPCPRGRNRYSSACTPVRFMLESLVSILAPFLDCFLKTGMLSVLLLCLSQGVDSNPCCIPQD